MQQEVKWLLGGILRKRCSTVLYEHIVEKCMLADDLLYSFGDIYHSSSSIPRVGAMIYNWVVANSYNALAAGTISSLVLYLVPCLVAFIASWDIFMQWRLNCFQMYEESISLKLLCEYICCCKIIVINFDGPSISRITCLSGSQQMHNCIPKPAKII